MKKRIIKIVSVSTFLLMLAIGSLITHLNPVAYASGGPSVNDPLINLDLSTVLPSIDCSGDIPQIPEEYIFYRDSYIFNEFRWFKIDQSNTEVTYQLQTSVWGDQGLVWDNVLFSTITGRYEIELNRVFLERLGIDIGTNVTRTLSIPVCQQVTKSGRMTGGGSIATTGNAAEGKHGFELYCDASKSPNKLEVNWGKGNKFHLEQLTSAVCQDTKVQTNKPSSDFDTYLGEGLGRFNGNTGYTAKWVFTDMGEPGIKDHAEISIYNAENVLIAAFNGYLRNGNHQAH